MASSHGGHSPEFFSELVLFCTVMSFEKECEFEHEDLASNSSGKRRMICDATKACCEWVRGLLDYLERGEVSNVLQRLRKIKKGSVEARAKLDDLIKYFDKHRERMRYAALRKAVIQARCRPPGMRWSVEGANAMLRLRCAWASGRLDDIFQPTSDELGSSPLCATSCRMTFSYPTLDAPFELPTY